MFTIGDKVVYPVHGAGTIESIEEREVLGEKHKYYVMKLSVGSLTVLIPTESIQDAGLRKVIDENEVKKVYQILGEAQIDSGVNWNQRYKENMEKIRSGDIYEVTEVVKELMLREKEKGLSTGEKKMLDTAKQILVSELLLAGKESEREILSFIDRALEKTSWIFDVFFVKYNIESLFLQKPNLKALKRRTKIGYNYLTEFKSLKKGV